MKRNLRIYFEKPIDEIDLQAMLDQEFDRGEVDVLKVDDDRRGVRYALVSATDEIPIGVLELLGDKNNRVTSVVKEDYTKVQTPLEELIIEEDMEIQGYPIKKGSKIVLV